MLTRRCAHTLIFHARCAGVSPHCTIFARDAHKYFYIDGLQHARDRVATMSIKMMSRESLAYHLLLSMMHIDDAMSKLARDGRQRLS